jgi:fumarylacetoacetate (FAA) hydrolase family protein
MNPSLALDVARALPDDGTAGTLIARVWRPGAIPGPAVAVVRADGVCDISAHYATVSTLLECDDPAARARAAAGERIGALDAILANSDESRRDPQQAFFLAPCDLQVVKAAGVTFATSLIERVIEEQAGGDPARAEAVRAEVEASIGGDLRAEPPGSAQAMAIKKL